MEEKNNKTKTDKTAKVAKKTARVARKTAVSKNNKPPKPKKANEYDLITVVVNRGFSDYVISAAREAGATGGTILVGRGTVGDKNNETLGINIHLEKEVILILVNRNIRKSTMRSIVKASNLYEEGKGLCFSLPVNDILGAKNILSSQK